MSDFDAPKDWLTDYIKTTGKPVTPSVFIRAFNQGLANAKMEDYMNAGLIQSPKSAEEINTVIGGTQRRGFKNYRVQTFTRNGKQVQILRDSKGRFTREFVN